MAKLTTAVADAGADAALVVAPYYNKPNRAGLRAHYEAVAEAAPELPIVVYNIPSRVVVNMDPGLLAELASIDNVVAVKQANDDELGPIEGMAVLAGNDGTFLRTLEFGGAGGVLVGSVPNAFRVQSRLRFLRGRPPEDDPTHLHMFSPAAVRELLAGFDDVRIEYVGGRYRRLGARLFARDLVFSARKP